MQSEKVYTLFGVEKPAFVIELTGEVVGEVFLFFRMFVRLAFVWLCFWVVCGEKSYIDIDTFATDTSVKMQTAEDFYNGYTWYAPPSLTGYETAIPSYFQDLTSDVIGTSRESIFGYTSAAFGSSVSSQVLNNRLVTIFESGYQGTAYYQWDGLGVSSPFAPEDLQMFPGFAPDTSIPESDGTSVDFTSGGLAAGLGFVFFPNSRTVLSKYLRILKLSY